MSSFPAHPLRLAARRVVPLVSVALFCIPAFCGQEPSPYPYRGPANLMIAHVSAIDGKTVAVWGRDSNDAHTYPLSDKIRYCKLDNDPKASTRVSDWSYLKPKIDEKGYVTLKLSRNLKTVEIIWDKMPLGHPYTMTLSGPSFPTPQTSEGMEYGFPPVCK